MTGGPQDKTVRDVVDQLYWLNSLTHDQSLPPEGRELAARDRDLLRATAVRGWYASKDPRLQRLASSLDVGIDFSDRRSAPDAELRGRYASEVGATPEELEGRLDLFMGELGLRSGAASFRPLVPEEAHALGLLQAGGAPMLDDSGFARAAPPPKPGLAGRALNALGNLAETAAGPKSRYAYGADDPDDFALLLDDVAALPAGIEDTDRIAVGQILMDPAEGGVIQTVKGPISLLPLHLGESFDIVSPSGEVARIEVNQGLLNELESAQQGGYLGHGLAGVALRSLYHVGASQDPTAWRVETPYGEMLTPNITGNPAMDRMLMEDPVWLRSMREADRASGTSRFLRGATGVATMVGEIAATNVVGKALLGQVGRFASSRMRGITLPTISSWANAAAEGATRAQATSMASGLKSRVPGLAFDLRQIPEMVWYESMNWAAGQTVGRDETLSSRLGQGLEMGLVGAMAGHALRGAQAAAKMAVLSGPFDKLLRTVSRGRWDGLPRATRDWLTRWDNGPDREMISRAFVRGNQVRNQAAQAIKTHVLESMDEVQSRFMRDRLMHQAVDGAIVMSWFGAHSGAMQLAQDEGRDWESMPWDEQVEYWFRSYSTPAPYAAAMGALVGHGASYRKAMSRATRAGMFDESAQKAVDDMAELVAHSVQRFGDLKDSGLAAGAMTAVQVWRTQATPAQLEALMALGLGRQREEDVAAREAAEVQSQAVRVVLDMVGREGGPETLRTMLRALSPEEMRSMASRVRDVSLDRDTGLRIAGKSLLEMIRSEFVSRRRGVKEAAEQPVEARPTEPTPEAGPAASDPILLVAGKPFVVKGGRLFPYRGEGGVPAQKQPAAGAEGQTPPRVIPPEEWSKEFSPEHRFLGIPGMTQGSVVYRLGKTRFAVIEGTGPDGAPAYFVTQGRRAADMRVVKGTEVYSYDSQGLQRAMGVALAKSKTIAIDEVERYWLGLRKTPPRIVEELDAARIKEMPAGSQALLDALREAADRASVKRQEAEQRKLEYKQRSEESYAADVARYKRMRAELGEAYMQRIGRLIQNPRRKEAWQEVMGGEPLPKAKPATAEAAEPEAVQAVAQRVVEAVELAPGQAGKDPAQLAFEFMGEGPWSKQELAEVAAEAEAARHVAPVLVDPGAQPAAATAPPEQQLWSDPGDLQAFHAGVSMTALRSNRSLLEAAMIGLEAEARGAAATEAGDLAMQVATHQRRQALASGMLASAPSLSKPGGKARTELISAVTGLSIKEIHALHARMVEAGASRDAHIDAVLDAFTTEGGKRLISAKQAARSDTRELLRIAAIAPIKHVSPGKPRLPGPQAIKALRKAWDDGGYKPLAQLLLERGGVTSEAMAKAKADLLFIGDPKSGVGGRLHAIARALTAADRARAPDLAQLLQERIAYRQFRSMRTGSSQPVPGTGRTLRQLTLELLSNLGGRSVREVVHEKGERKKDLPQSTSAAPRAPNPKSVEAPVASESLHGEEFGASYLRALKMQEGALEALWEIPTLGRVRELLEQKGADDYERGEAGLMRRLIDGDSGLAEMFDSFHGEDGPRLFSAARIAATEAAAFAQDHIRNSAAQRERAVEGGNPELVLAQIDTLYEALAIQSRGEALPAEMVETLRKPTSVLPKGGVWTDAEGRNWVAPTVQRDMARMLVDTLRDVAPDRATEVPQRYEGDVGGALRMYGGVHFDRHSMARFARAAMAWVGGYGLARDSDVWATRSRFSIHRLAPKIIDKLSLRRVMDSLYRDDPAWRSKSHKKLAASVIKALTPIWQRYIARGQSSGTYATPVAQANLRLRRSRLATEADTGEFVTQAKRLLDRMAKMRLSSYDAAFVGKLIEAGGHRRVQSEAEFERVFGEGSGYLFSVMRDTAALFARLGEEMVSVGAIDMEAFKTLRGRYLPKIILNLDAGPEAQLARQRSAESKAWAVDSSRFPRETDELAETAARIWDVRYLLPVGVARETKLLTLWRTIDHVANDPGGLLSAAEYEALPDGAKIHYRKAAERVGRDRAGEFTPEEMASLSPSEREAITRRRRTASIEQVMVQELIDGERAAAQRGDLEITEAMATMLDRLEHGYVTANALGEIGLAIEFADVSHSEFRSRVGDYINELTRVWRELRTFHSPKFWVLNNTTSLGTNHMTGRLNMLDILDLDGYYHRGGKMVAEFLRWEADGSLPEMATANVQLVRDFMRLMGRNNLMAQIQGPQRMADLLESMLTPSDMDAMIPEGPGQATRMGDRTLRELLIMEYRGGRTHAEVAKDLYKLWGSANPEERFAANQQLAGMQATHEAWLKFAPYLRALERGMPPQEAAEWAAKGTGDYQDRNPFIYRLTTSFTSSTSQVEGKAWARLRGDREEGAPARINMLRTMVGSPFWQYRMSMYPELANSMVTHTGKMIAATGIQSAIFAGISAAFGGDEAAIADGLSGHGEFVNAKLTETDADKLALRYSDVILSGIPGQYGITVGEQLGFWKAWSKRVLHNVTFGMAGSDDDRGNMIAVARGPSLGGKSYYFDLSEFLRVPVAMSQGFSRLGAAVVGSNDYKQFSSATAAEELGLAFVPSMIAAGAYRAFGLAKGRTGESRWETATEMVLDGLAEMSAPMGGGLLTSSHGQRLTRNVLWDGRSLHEIIDGLPGSGYAPTPAGGAAHALAGMLLPLRQLPSGRGGSRDATLLGALGLDDPYLRRGEDAESVDAQLRQRSVRETLQNLYSQAYKEHRATGIPLAAIHQRMFDLTPDAVLDGAGNMIDVAENPSSELGRYVRSRGGDAERQLYLRSVVNGLRLHRNDLEMHLTGAGGLAYRTDVAPEVHDRIVRAVWNRQGTPARMVDFLYGAVFKGSNRGWSSKYDGLWYRMYFNEGLHRHTAATSDSASAVKLERLRKWVAERKAGMSIDYAPETYTQSVVEGVRGRTVDVAPARYIQSLPSVDVLTSGAGGRD